MTGQNFGVGERRFGGRKWLSLLGLEIIFEICERLAKRGGERAKKGDNRLDKRGEL